MSCKTRKVFRHWLFISECPEKLAPRRFFRRFPGCSARSAQRPCSPAQCRDFSDKRGDQRFLIGHPIKTAERRVDRRILYFSGFAGRCFDYPKLRSGRRQISRRDICCSALHVGETIFAPAGKLTGISLPSAIFFKVTLTK